MTWMLIRMRKCQNFRTCRSITGPEMRSKIGKTPPLRLLFSNILPRRKRLNLLFNPTAAAVVVMAAAVTSSGT